MSALAIEKNTEKNEKLSQYLWTLFIVMLFLVPVIIWTTAIMLTSKDSSHSVVAGYHEEALRWDETQVSERASAALKWDVVLSVGQPADVLGNRPVELSLKDSSADPVENVTLVVNMFHRGRSADVQRIEMVEESPGVYAGAIQVQHTGLWQFSGTAVRDDQQYLIDEQRLIEVERGR